MEIVRRMYLAVMIGIVAAFLAVVGGGLTAATAAPLSASETTGICPVTEKWDDSPERRAGSTTRQIRSLEAGVIRCYDWITFNIKDMPAVGYSARYVKVVSQEGSGKPMRVPGKADLRLTVNAPAKPLGEPGRYLFRQDDTTPPMESVEAVRYAGTFEGRSTFAIGVDERRDFRVYLYDYDGPGARLFIEIAHQ